MVDAELGLVCVDRNTVPSGLGDVSLTFGNTETVTGKVVYVRDALRFDTCTSYAREHASLT